MFKTLKYDVTFPDTGRRLHADLTFEAGFSAITGENESGKSFILEMLRYGLFGTQALRGAAADYATLSMEMRFSIKSEDYRIVRTMRRAELFRGDEQIASGTSVVNEKIVSILGFGILVFDTACSINQGEVERLGAMSPAERKRLVDSVLGIEALDIVSRWGMDEARLLEREADVLAKSLRAPVEPIKPDPYVQGIDIEKHRNESRELAEIDGWLSHPRAEPVAPTPVDPVDPVLVEERREMREAIARTSAQIGALPVEAPYSVEQLDAAETQWDQWDQWCEARKWLADNPRPPYFPQQYMVFKQDWIALANIEQRDALLARIDALKAKGSRPCPKCGEDIPMEQEAMEAFQAQADTIEVPPCPIDAPPISLQECEAGMRRLWDEVKFNEMNAVECVPLPSVNRTMIPTYRLAITQVLERAELMDLLDKTEDEYGLMPDYEAMARDRAAYEQAHSRYVAELSDFNVWVRERDRKLNRRNEIIIDPDAEASYQAARDYERALCAWDADKQHYDETVSEIERLGAEVTKHRKVRELMNILRSLIKQHLMPSLNRVASHLLQGMTGGQRNSIYVDEDFNITVDRQRLETLSGSGKACANLALRIALGQVLTNKVISVLLADEIDASMDDFRSQQTSDVLGTMAVSISQVLLVSHKSIEANNHIHLGGFIESNAGGTA